MVVVKEPEEQNEEKREILEKTREKQKEDTLKTTEPIFHK
jgi:hypothetical protein